MDGLPVLTLGDPPVYPVSDPLGGGGYICTCLGGGNQCATCAALSEYDADASEHNTRRVVLGILAEAGLIALPPAQEDGA